MITEFIGTTAALSIFHIPPVLAVVLRWLMMGAMILSGRCRTWEKMILSGRYWTWEKIALVFCALNLIYIPDPFMVALQ